MTHETILVSLIGGLSIVVLLVALALMLLDDMKPIKTPKGRIK